MKKVVKPVLTLLTVGTLLASAVPVLAANGPSPITPPAPAGTLHSVYTSGINSLKALKSQDQQVREQMKTLRQNLKESHANVGLNWANQKEINQAIKSDFQQLKADRQAKNAGAVQQDFTKLQGDLNHRLQADQVRVNILTAVQNNDSGLIQTRAQEKQVASQIKTVRQDIRAKISTDRQNKNKPALQAARADMAAVKSANQTVKAISLKTDLQQIKTDVQAGNADATAQDLAKLTGDMQNRVKAQQSLLTALQKVDSDL